MTETMMGVLVLALLAPLESLEWWARRYPTPSLPAPESEPATGIRRWQDWRTNTREFREMRRGLLQMQEDRQRGETND